jgi:hypothetical protein
MRIEHVDALFAPSLSPRMVRISGQVVGRERFFHRGKIERTFITLSDVDVPSALALFSCRTPHLVHVTLATLICGRAEVERCRAEIQHGDEVTVEGYAEVSPKGVAQISAMSFTLIRKFAGSQWYEYFCIVDHRITTYMLCISAGSSRVLKW